MVNTHYIRSNQLSRPGFTLIELLIVTIVIGIIGALGIVQYQSYVTTSRRNACMANQNAINHAYHLWQIRNVTLPREDACVQLIHPVTGEPINNHPKSQHYWRDQNRFGTGTSFDTIDGQQPVTLAVLPQGQATVADKTRWGELARVAGANEIFCCPELIRTFGRIENVPVPAAQPASSTVLYMFYQGPVDPDSLNRFVGFNPDDAALNYPHFQLYPQWIASTWVGGRIATQSRAVVCNAYGKYNYNRLSFSYDVDAADGVTKRYFVNGAGPDLSSGSLHYLPPP